MKNVNIVYMGRGGNDILDRLASALADKTGWPYSSNPSGAAEVNHFICYVEYAQHYSDWHQSEVSCWFTHYDQGQSYKEFWWELAANNVDLRITAARRYLPMLEPHGPTALCPRPAIAGQFKIQDRPQNKLPRVGLAGYVHPGGRKGEKLVAQLGTSKFGERLDLQAIGLGWPCPCRTLDWTDLPKWFNGLDVFLCTSGVEGIPMPPLEALACGVPVVIPRDVGLLDDLPDEPGIYRYNLTDFQGVCAAIETALATSHDREALRAMVAGYNAENWAADHVAAIEESKWTIPIESDRHGRRGVVYVAYGEPSRLCAKGAIESFKAHMPGIEVALIGTKPGLGEDIFIECPDVDIGGRYAKTRIYDLAPQDWQYIGYLDADTEVIANVSFLWDALIDGWDMVICKNPDKYHIAWQMQRSDNHDECEYTFAQVGTGELMQLNGGVFTFQRNQRTAAFFKAWHTEWQRWGKRDQGALLRALHANPVKMYVLGNEWNTITRYVDKPAEYSAGILHYPMTARRWRGKVIQRSDSPEAWQAVKEWERSQVK